MRLEFGAPLLQAILQSLRIIASIVEGGFTVLFSVARFWKITWIRMRGILVNLRAERRRLELMDMDIVEPSKKQKVNDQLTAIAEEISDLTEEMNIAQEAATPPRGGSKRS